MLSIQSINKQFETAAGTIIALKDISLDIADGEFVCLLGPSGCGKSTLLNAVAGFSLPSTGSISLNGKTITAPGPDRGMVFQEYALFPWMSIAQNISFGLEIKGMDKDARTEIVDRLLKVLNLVEFKDRYPKDLSGGMRQRVAIARVLALDSPVLLMDEPFGALDAQTRAIMQESLLRLWERIGNTVLFVTHDIDEALTLADRVVVISAQPGRVLLDLKLDLPRPRPEDLFASPAFAEYKRQCFKLIRQESRRAFEESENSSAARK